MFGHRPDGKKIKGVSGFDRMQALMVGKTRVDSTNQFSLDIYAQAFDDYIKQKSEKEGIDYSYRDIVIASIVRCFYLRPRLNRFVVAGNFYQRKFIDVSMSVHKNLKGGGNETTIKCRFTGRETLKEVKQSLDAEIMRAVSSDNSTDKLTGGMSWMPTWMFRMAVGVMKFLDRFGFVSDKTLFKASPFHCSMFFADLKSIHLDSVQHHLYNFGNCGFFCAMSKERKKPVSCPKTDQIKTASIVELKVSIDERFIDGLYYSGMIKAVKRMFEDPSCLETAPTDDEIKKLPLTPKQAKIEAKRKRKLAKK